MHPGPTRARRCLVDLQWPAARRHSPQAWLAEGRTWNEAYLLRAFLQYNAQFEVVLMNNFMAHRHADFFARHMPLCLRNTGGSLWLRKK